MTSKKTSTDVAGLGELGRAAEQVHAALRRKILDGAVSVGCFLPTERKLAAEFKVAHTTVRRAMAKLQVDGLIRSEPRKGCRVLGMANDPAQGCPVAYIRSVSAAPEAWDEFHARLSGALQESADRRNWPLVAMGECLIHSAKILTRLKASRAWAVILDSNDPGSCQAVKTSGLPVLMVDSWLEGSTADSVLQDGHGGGVLACRSLAAAGCRRIAWFGPKARNVHVLDRFGGYCAGLLETGLPVNSELMYSAAEDEVLAGARSLIASRKRFDGVVALWSTHAAAVARAAAEGGLVIGRDFQLVGWCPEELYAREYVPAFGGARVAPAITWSIRAMADAVMALLAERRANPGLPPLRVRIPATLKPGT